MNINMKIYGSLQANAVIQPNLFTLTNAIILSIMAQEV